MELFKVVDPQKGCIWVGVFRELLFTTRKEAKLEVLCSSLGCGIPVDFNTRQYTPGEFIEYAKEHPILKTVDNWEDIFT
jgi:hypothetical protein